MVALAGTKYNGSMNTIKWYRDTSIVHHNWD